MNIHMNNLLAEIIEPLTQCQESAAVVSSEALLAEVDKLNKELETESNSQNPKVQRDLKNLLLE